MTTTPTTSSDFSEPTADWLSDANLARRKQLGQYMTPRTLREALVERLDLHPGIRVLDPGVGTGEFLKTVLDKEPTAVTTGWDVDPEILKFAETNVPAARLELRNALVPYTGQQFDLVIGNPPYFQFAPSKAERSHYSQVISGRANIFALFFQVGLSVLRPGGQLAYVVPPSMNNGAYFNALRKYIIGTARIEWLKLYPAHDLFIDAQTAVQLIVIRSGVGPSAHCFVQSNAQADFSRTIFCEDPTSLHNQFTGRSTLHELGYEAVTGSIVWNQHRDQLHRSPGSGRVPLIWAHNLADGEIVLHHDHKRPQYVETERALTGPAIVTNRILGSVGAGTFRCGLVPDGMAFVGENHVNVIRKRRGTDPSVPWSELLALLRSSEVSPRARLITGNTQLSATELTHMLPLGA